MSKGQKLLIAVAILFGLWVIGDPTGAAAFVQDVLAWLKEGLDAIITFLKNVFTQ